MGDTFELSLRQWDPSKVLRDRRCILIGKPATGKSCASVDIMYHLRDMADGVVFSPTDKFTGQWESFVPPISVYDGWDSKVVQQVFDRQYALWKAKWKQLVEEARQNGTIACKEDVKIEPVYIIADDCLADSAFTKDPLLNQIFMNGRHLKIFFMATCQWLLSMKIQQRQLVDYLVVAAEDSPPALIRLYDSFFSGYFPTYQAFVDVLQAVTQNYGMLVLDRTNRTSNKFEDHIFWWKPQLRKQHSFKIGSPEFWQYSMQQYQEKLQLDTQPIDPQVGMGLNPRQSKRPRIQVRQLDANGNPYQ